MAAGDIISDDDIFGASPKTEDQTSAPSKAGEIVSDEDIFGMPVKAGPNVKPLSNVASDTALSSAAKATGTALTKGLVSGVAGWPGNLQAAGSEIGNRLIQAGNKAASFVTGNPSYDIPIEAIRQKAAEAEKLRKFPIPDLPTGQQIFEKGIKPLTGEYVPTSEPGKLGMGALQTGVESLGPGMGGKITGLGIDAIKTLAKMIPGNIASTTAAQLGTDYVSPGFGMAAGFLAPAVGTAAWRAARPVTEPMFSGNLPRLVQEKLQGTIQDPAAVSAELASGTTGESGPLTSAQLTGDPGLLAAQKALKDAGDPRLAAIEGQQQLGLKGKLAGQAPLGANTMDPVQFFNDRRNDIETRAQAAEDSIRSKAQADAASLGPSGNPETIGAEARAKIEDIRRQEKQIHTDLYKAVGNPDIVTSGVREGIGDIESGVSPMRKPSPEVQDIFDRAKKISDVMPLNDMDEFGKDIGQAMRDELASKGESNNYRLLVQARSHVQNSIDNAFQNQAEWQTKALNSGQTPTGPIPNMIDDEGAKLAAAREQYAKYAEKFKTAPIAQTIQSSGPQGQYKTFASAVPDQMVKPGPTGYEVSSKYLQSANSNEVQTAMKERMLDDLRGRVGADGTLPTKAIDAWKGKYSGSLRAIDEVDPGFSTSFDHAGNSAQRLQDFTTRLKGMRDAIDKSAAGAFMGVTDPREVENRIGSMLSNGQEGPSQISQLIAQTKGDPNAISGFQKAATDWMGRKFLSTREIDNTGEASLASAGFQKFINNNEPALRNLFADRPESVDAMKAIASDMQKINRPTKAAFDEFKAGKRSITNFPATILQKIQEHPSSIFTAEMIGSMMAAHEVYGLPGAIAAGVGSAAVKSGYGFLKKLHASGISNVNDAFNDAIRNPERLQHYLTVQTPNRLGAQADILTRSIMRGRLASEVTGQQKRFGRMKGGRIEARKLGIEADRANKSLGGALKPLMHMPDETIVHALRLAK